MAVTVFASGAWRLEEIYVISCLFVGLGWVGLGCLFVCLFVFVSVCVCVC